MSMVISDSVERKAKDLAAKRGFKTTDDYLINLFDRDEAEAIVFAGIDEELKKAILEGLDSGPSTPMTREDWNSLKSRIDALPDNG